MYLPAKCALITAATAAAASLALEQLRLLSSLPWVLLLVRKQKGLRLAEGASHLKESVPASSGASARPANYKD